MTLPLIPGEEACARVLARAYRGIHHVPYWRRRKPWGNGIAVSVQGRMATFDFDVLTRLVVAAHDECVRVEIVPGGPGLLKVCLHPRKDRVGPVWERHPTIEDAIVRARDQEAKP